MTGYTPTYNSTDLVEVTIDIVVTLFVAILDFSTLLALLIVFAVAKRLFDIIFPGKSSA